MKKLILIISFFALSFSLYATNRLVVGVVETCHTGGMVRVSRTYIKAVEDAGFVPLVLPFTENEKTIKAFVDKIDILLLTGGEDVAPVRYGHKESPKLGAVNLMRDDFEFRLLDIAKAKRLPMFGICRGCQVLNVYFGGTLYQDIPSEITPTAKIKIEHSVKGKAGLLPMHSAKVVDGTRLASIVGAGNITVNTYHHQCAMEVAPGFVASAVAPDGVVEAIESSVYPAAGVQFHPEKILYDGDTRYELSRIGEIFARLPELAGLEPLKETKVVADILTSTDDATLLKAFIAIPSTSRNIPQVNRMSEAMAQHLKVHGIKCTMEKMPDGRKVLFACSRDTKTPDVLISAHLDVVSAQSPSMYNATITNGVLYGRGASDCKGHCVLAARLLRELKDKVSIGCIFGSDEEIGGASTKWMVDEKGYGAKKVAFVFDMEPYSVTTRQKGLGGYEVIATAAPVHTGLIKGPPPKSALRRILDGCDKLGQTLPSFEDGSWRDTASISSINGNSVKATVKVTIKNSKNDDWAELEKKLASCFPGCEIKNSRKSPAVILDESEPVMNEFLRRTKVKLCDGKGHKYDHYYHLDSSTDARHLQNLGVPLIITGTDCHGGHTPREHMNLWSMQDYFELVSEFVLDYYKDK